MKNKELNYESWEYAKTGGLFGFRIRMSNEWAPSTIKAIMSPFKLKNYKRIYTKHIECNEDYNYINEKSPVCPPNIKFGTPEYSKWWGNVMPLWINTFNSLKCHKKCIYTVEEFDPLWVQILKNCKSHKNKWLPVKQITQVNQFPNHIYLTFLKLVAHGCLDVKRDKKLVFKFKKYPNPKYIAN
jgi:hypothetical protein